MSTASITQLPFACKRLSNKVSKENQFSVTLYKIIFSTVNGFQFIHVERPFPVFPCLSYWCDYFVFARKQFDTEIASITFADRATNEKCLKI
jgi:hypothetical protein